MKKLLFFVIVLAMMFSLASVTFAAAVFIKSDVPDGAGSGTLNDPFSPQDGFNAGGTIYALDTGGPYITPNLFMNVPGTELYRSPGNFPVFNVGITLNAEKISISGIEFDIEDKSITAITIPRGADNARIIQNGFDCAGTFVLIVGGIGTKIYKNYPSSDSPRGTGIVFEIGSDLLVTGNVFNNAIGIILRGGNNSDIQDNSFVHGHGIVVYRGMGIQVDHNHFTDNETGIFVRSGFSDSINIANNKFKQFDCGIDFNASNGGLHASENNFYAGKTAIKLSDGKTTGKIIIYKNAFNDTDKGIYVYSENEETWLSALYIDENIFDVKKDQMTMGIDFNITKDIGSFSGAQIRISKNKFNIKTTGHGNNAYGINLLSLRGSIYVDIYSNTINVASDETAFGSYFKAGKDVFAEIYENSFDVIGKDNSNDKYPANAFCTYIKAKGLTGCNKKSKLRPTVFSGNTIKLDMEITIPDEFKVTYPPGMEEFPLYVRSGNVTTRFLCIPICGGNYVDLISHGPNNPILRGDFPIGITTKAASLSAEAWMNFGFPPPGPPPPWYGDPDNPGSGFDYVSY